MKQFLILIFFILSLQAYSQKRVSRKIEPKYFIGTWKLTKLADKNLNFRNDSVDEELLKFTKDSIFIIMAYKNYSGTWRLAKGQPEIKIHETNNFNYTWIAGTDNSKFFTTKGLSELSKVRSLKNW